MRRLRVVLLAVLLPSLAWAGVVWRGDFETGGLGQYSSIQRVSADRLQVVQSPVAQGKYALKATVQQGDDPINASGNRNELAYLGPEKEGAEYYYHWKVMFASDFPSVKTWQVFTQWHHTGCCGSPPVEFFVYGEEIRLTLTDSETPWTTKLVRGQWQDFVFHVKWSSDPSVGFVELWHNGQPVLTRYTHATMYAGDGVYLKLGLYRSDTVQQVGVVYHDAFTQATQLADVMPAQTAPPTDAGTPDAGTPDAGPSPNPSSPDAGGTSPSPDAGTSTSVDEPSEGVETPPLSVTAPAPSGATSSSPESDLLHGGCSSAGEPLWAAALMVLGGLLRRGRRPSQSQMKSHFNPLARP